MHDKAKTSWCFINTEVLHDTRCQSFAFFSFWFLWMWHSSGVAQLHVLVRRPKAEKEITGEGDELRAALGGHTRPQRHHGHRALALSDTSQ